MSKLPTAAEVRWSGLSETPTEDHRRNSNSDTPTIRRRGHSASGRIVPQTQNSPDRPYWEPSVLLESPLASYQPPPDLHTSILSCRTTGVYHHASHDWDHPQPPWMSYPYHPHRRELPMIHESPLASYPSLSSVNVQHQRTPPPLDPHARIPPPRINHHTSHQPPWMSYIPQTYNRLDYLHRRQQSTILESLPVSYPSHSGANVQNHVDLQSQRAPPPLDPYARTPPPRLGSQDYPQLSWPPLSAAAATLYDDTQPPPHTYGKLIPLPSVDGDIDHADAVQPNPEGTSSSRPLHPAFAECRCRASATGTSRIVTGLDTIVLSQRAICDCNVYNWDVGCSSGCA